MAQQFKSLKALSKAYADGKILKKNKLVLNDDGTATVTAVPLDKEGKPVKGAAAEVVFSVTQKDLLQEAIKLAGVPVAAPVLV